MLYVPSAQRLIEGGTFQKGKDGLWDTPEVAKDLLRSMVTNHKEQLADISITSGQTLLQVFFLALDHRIILFGLRCLFASASVHRDHFSADVVSQCLLLCIKAVPICGEVVVVSPPVSFCSLKSKLHMFDVATLFLVWARALLTIKA